MELDINILNDEFLIWTGDFGNGRNNNDLRFGQFLHCKYHIETKEDDGFYDEVPRDSYTKIINNLKQKHV
jgi:hypothetical protein